MTKKRLLALTFVFGGLFGTTTWLVADDDGDDHHKNRWNNRTELRALAPVNNPVWKEECGSCHMLYHPGLLPERSWREMMAGLEKHFGDDASLDAETNQAITQFLLANSAEKSQSKRSRRIAASIPANDTPLRISETRYFLRKHDEIEPAVFKRKAIGGAANCAACHRQPETGDFSEENVRIPSVNAIRMQQGKAVP